MKLLSRNNDNKILKVSFIKNGVIGKIAYPVHRDFATIQDLFNFLNKKYYVKKRSDFIYFYE